ASHSAGRLFPCKWRPEQCCGSVPPVHEDGLGARIRRLDDIALGLAVVAALGQDALDPVKARADTPGQATALQGRVARPSPRREEAEPTSAPAAIVIRAHALPATDGSGPPYTRPYKYSCKR